VETSDHPKNGAYLKSLMSRKDYTFYKMKYNRILVTPVFFTIILFFFAVSYSFGQNHSMGSEGILGKLQAVIDEAEKRDMEVVRIEADIIRTTKETIRMLAPSFSYSIVAVACNRIEDIDIEVYENVNYEWVLINKDDDTEDVAAVAIQPSTYAEYKIVVKAYKFYTGYDVGHYGLAIIHE